MPPSPDPLNPLLDHATPAQARAITHVDGPLLVLAGAGSGKTRVITRRVANLVRHGIAPESILAVTFTNKAAREMKERIAALLEEPGLHGDRVWVNTFHAFCARLLRREIERLDYPRAFTIYDESDRLSLITNVMKELKIDTDVLAPSAASAVISRAKNDSIGPRDYEREADGTFAQMIARVYVRYEHSMKTSGALDFDDLLLKALELLREHPDVRRRWCARFDYVLIDEYQDTNRIQYRLVHFLAGEHKNLCVTGDPDQAIYSWRGADVDNILSFERDFEGAEVILLEQNFRSLANILRAADGVIAHNVKRKPKRLVTDAEDGDPIALITVPDEFEEARTAVRLVREHSAAGGPLRECAVFYRTNALSRSLERAFLEAGIPYDVVGTVAFYDRKEIKDLLAYLRVVVNPDDDLSLVRILNVPARGIGARTLEHLRAFADTTGQRLRAVVSQAGRRDTSVPGLGPRQRSALRRFDGFLVELEDRRHRPVGEFIEQLVEDIEYLDYLDQKGDPRADERKENVLELIASAREFEGRAGHDDSLVAFLEDVALVSQVDLFADEEDRVSLMTIHNAKGLEFDLVVLAGFEDGLLPHARSLDAGGDDAIEEERRLCYVAITRAKKRLAILHAMFRNWGGVPGSPRTPSRFVDEIPDEVLERHAAVSQRRYDRPTSDWTHDEVDWTTASDEPDAWEADPPVRTADPPTLESGQLVRHEIFGIGRVVRIEGAGPGRKVRIRFTTAGERLLVLEYANLTVVN